MPNQAPALTGISASASVTQYGVPVTLASGLSLSDADTATLAGARVRITSGFTYGDALFASTAGTSITAGYDINTGVLTLSGTDTLAHYQSVLRSISFYTSAIKFANGTPDTSRTITWQADDGQSGSNLSNAPTTTVTVGAASAVPSGPANVVLNPLPNSVLIDPNLFKVNIVPGSSVAPGNDILYGYSGDLTGDGYPEIVISGWDHDTNFSGNVTTSTPPAKTTPIYVLSTSASGTTLLDATTLLGQNTSTGTAIIRIGDFNGDGRNDLALIAHNEDPFVPTANTIFFGNANGSFTASTFGPNQTAHNGGFYDFNGDGKLDLIASAYAASNSFNPYIEGVDSSGKYHLFHTGQTYPQQLLLWLNNGSGTFNAIPVIFTKPVDQVQAAGGEKDWSSGSSSAIADFDGNGVPDIVVSDFAPANNPGLESQGNTWIIRNVQVGTDNAYGTPVKLPQPYFENPTYSSMPSMFIDTSHDVQVEVMDFNNDGKPDILVHSMVWTSNGNASGAVTQFLRNDGNFKFTDVTNSTLYNSFLGMAAASHDSFQMDVNGDGFIDIVNVDDSKFNSDFQTEQTSSWSNEILINTGTGKFVAEMWDGFHQLTQQNLKALTEAGLSFPENRDARLTPYMTPDGMLGFVGFQRMFSSGSNRYYFTDYRASGKLYTGPGGANPALQGAPGFNEAYYLTQYSDAAAAVTAGTYASGLAHYLAVGKTAGNFAFAANATVQGSESGDTIQLREGNETAYGYGGADTFIGGAGDDRMDGGDSAGDLATYAAARTDLTLGLASGGGFTVSSALDGTDTLTNIEAILAEGVTYTLVGGTNGDDTLSNSGAIEEEDALVGGAGVDVLVGGNWRDMLSGGDDSDTLNGKQGNDILDGGSNIDTAVFSGNKSAYTITQTSTGKFTITGPDGTDLLRNVEYAKFDDQTVRLLPGSGTSLTIQADSNNSYPYLSNIRDFDGNDLAGREAFQKDSNNVLVSMGPWDGVSGWSLAGHADVSGSGNQAYIFFNRQVGRWAEVTVQADGKVYFDNNNWGGDTRVVGIYTDPEVVSDPSKLGGPFDSQRRFQNDLFIGNLKAVEAVGDYNHDGFQEVYFSLTDGTAYLHALMWNDGNIKYANYQNAQEVQDYLTANGVAPATWSSWLHEEPPQVFAAPGGMAPPLVGQEGSATLAGVAV